MKRINKQGFTYMQDIYDAMNLKAGDWICFRVTGGKLTGEKV
jgi:hypothetical protein